jgi:hypothetical protein
VTPSSLRHPTRTSDVTPAAWAKAHSARALTAAHCIDVVAALLRHR